MKYRIYGNMSVWGWSDFRREAGLKIIDHNTVGSIVNYIDYEYTDSLNKDVLKKYEVRVEIINDDNKVQEEVNYMPIREENKTKNEFKDLQEEFKALADKQKEIKRLKKEYSKQLYNELPKDCSTCEFNFGDICASEFYGEKIEELEKRITECDGWSIGLEAYSEIGNKISNKFRDF
ncbi:MAG: hypothetical protein ACRC1T_05340 [Clostridium chrysemydis]|uniref:hypothetical protein n=1 Tax=Clostridium chrysemydis TaxID=2665504 RepID=UPI003F2D6A76